MENGENDASMETGEDDAELLIPLDEHLANMKSAIEVGGSKKRRDIRGS